jgi:hypothetical protein
LGVINRAKTRGKIREG